MCTPDTGASRTIVSLATLRRHGLVFAVNQDTKPILFTANNTPLDCLGTVILTATTDEGTSAKIDALVVSDLSNEVLVSWHDLQALGIIPRSFPSSSASANSVQRLSSAYIPEDSIEKIKEDFKDVLSDKLNSKPMAGPPMRIHLKEGAIPFRISTARQVPLRFQAEADKVIQDLLDKHVIERVSTPTEWCAPAFWVPKSCQKKVRLVTDFSRINEWVRRPVHPFPSSRDIVRSVPPDARFFAKLDAVHGYFQIALDEESSFLTTFLLPSGRYRYLRAPMGLSSSSDEYCSRTDHALMGIPDCNKIVDDILTWAPLLPRLFSNMRLILSRCRANNITISISKLTIGTKITFAGYVVSGDGISPDPRQVEAIQKFPVPQCIKDLRAFLGLVNQLAGFVPDILQMSVDMRELLKKNRAWLWLPSMQAEFENLKNVLTSDLVVKPFDPSLETFLVTDAARLFGLGFGLFQKGPERNHLIQCGSCSLSDCQRRYAVVELEMLGVKWAIRKLDYFLRGLPMFTVWTDHRPLEGIFQKEIFQIDNPRIQRMRETLTPYTFKVKWVEGKRNIFADVLSRFPVFSPEADDGSGDAPVFCFKINTLTLSDMFQKAKLDDAYQIAIKAIRESEYKGQESEKNEFPIRCPLPDFKPVWSQLSLYDCDEGTLITFDADRIVVPSNLRQQVLAALHSSHSGLNKTNALARQLYFWPTMNNDIKNVVSSCSACRARLPSLPSTPLQLTTASSPMSQVGTDLFEIRGQHWLVMVDRFSGFVWCHRLAKTNTTAVTNRLRSWFVDFGFPARIRSDGGPQFRGDFNAFCEENGIVHELTSPYNSQSNGLAEAAVKNIKTLLSKCMDTGEDFQLALSAWRNTPRADGFSPAQLFLGRRQRSPAFPTLPVHHEGADVQAGAAARNQRLAAKAKEHDAHAHALSPLNIGDPVHVQNPFTHKWDTSAIVESVRDNGSSYTIKYGGKTYIRNRKFLRPAASSLSSPFPSSNPDATSASHALPHSTVSKPSDSSPITSSLPSLRRSSRLAAKANSVSFDLPAFIHR